MNRPIPDPALFRNVRLNSTYAVSFSQTRMSFHTRFEVPVLTTLVWYMGSFDRKYDRRLKGITSAGSRRNPT
jgi:hypothetical protein